MTHRSLDELDFWRWGTSDLITNTTRGVLVEYIVARALGTCTQGVRGAWRVFPARIIHERGRMHVSQVQHLAAKPG